MPTPTDVTNPPGPPPGDGNPNGGDGGDNPKVLTEEEHARRMRGKASEAERALKRAEAAEARLAELEADAKKRSEAALADQGKDKELAALREKERDAALAELQTHKARETKRVETVEASNKERVKALPDEVKKLIPPGLDADTLSMHLSTLEAHAQQAQGPGVFRSGPKPLTDLSPDDAITEGNKRLREIQADPFASRLPAGDRGVTR